MEIIGNSKIVEYFNRGIDKGNLSHAYCLAGIDQIGKRKLARTIASKIFDVPQDKLETHPDFHYLSRIINKKTGKLRKDIIIEQVRYLKSRISSKSWVSSRNIILINEAELLNKESGNALLKVLEEGEGKSIFFLLTNNDNALLTTIRSRCQIFYMNPVSEDVMTEGLKKIGFSEDVDQVVRLSWGRPGRAIDLMENEEIRDEYLNEFKRWKNIIGNNFGDKLKCVDDLVGKKKGIDKEKMMEILDVWIVLWRGIMRSVINEKRVKLKIEYSLQSIRSLIDLLNESKKMLRQNINPNLIIENILLTI